MLKIRVKYDFPESCWKSLKFFSVVSSSWLYWAVFFTFLGILYVFCLYTFTVSLSRCLFTSWFLLPFTTVSFAPTRSLNSRRWTWLLIVIWEGSPRIHCKDSVWGCLGDHRVKVCNSRTVEGSRGEPLPFLPTLHPVLSPSWHSDKCVLLSPWSC